MFVLCPLPVEHKDNKARPAQGFTFEVILCQAVLGNDNPSTGIGKVGNPLMVLGIGRKSIAQMNHIFNVDFHFAELTHGMRQVG